MCMNRSSAVLCVAQEVRGQADVTVQLEVQRGHPTDSPLPAGTGTSVDEW